MVGKRTGRKIIIWHLQQGRLCIRRSFVCILSSYLAHHSARLQFWGVICKTIGPIFKVPYRSLSMVIFWVICYESHTNWLAIYNQKKSGTQSHVRWVHNPSLSRFNSDIFDIIAKIAMINSRTSDTILFVKTSGFPFMW